MRARTAAAALVLGSLVALLAGCGSSGNDMAPSAAQRLETEVRQVREAIEAGDAETARAHLTSMRTSVTEFIGTGHLTSQRALRIYDAIDDLEAELASQAPATTTTTTTSPPRATTTSTTTSTSTTTTDAPRGKGKKKDDDDD
jgi:ribosomal protein S20